MKIQIVIPTINLWNKYTHAAITSVQEAMVSAKKHNIDCRILLIDNASTDETKVEAGKMVSDLFSHLRNEERWGFQKSVNVGVKDGFERGYDIVLICNNDIILHPEALWRVAERFRKGDVGMVTCMDIRGEIEARIVHPSITAVSNIRAVDKENVDEAPNPNFSAFAVNKECWDMVGKFDEVFAPAYFEDNDYHYRMNLAGVKAIVCPPAMFYHYGSRTQNEANENGLPFVSGGEFENARAKFVKKWGGLPGKETFKTPYNDPLKTVKSIKQDE